MRAWVVRAGRHGQRERAALEEGLVVVGWDHLGDLMPAWTRDDIKELVVAAYPDEEPRTVGNWTGQLYRFRHEISVGDLVVLPLKSAQVAIGHVDGGYEYRADAPDGLRHVRRVRWLVRDVARERFHPDLLDSMGSLLTVFELTRFGAPYRITAIFQRGTDPGRPGADAFAATMTEPAKLYEEVIQRSPENPVQLSVRDFLRIWNAQRRYPAVVEEIERDLAARGMVTVPSFTEGDLDSRITVLPLGDEPDDQNSSILTRSGVVLTDENQPEVAAVAYRISNLESANRMPECVRVGDSLRSAMTLMTLRGFSQLPVLDQDGRLRGVVSWESIGRARMSNDNAELDAAIVKAREADRSDDLLDWIADIQQSGYVIVRDRDHKVCGLVTSADLTGQFGVRLRPFVLVEEVEQRLRVAVGARISLERIREKVPPKQASKIQSSADLTFGAYKHILGVPENWKAMGWAVDHKLFLTALEECRQFRNNLMHFSPDPITDDQLVPVRGLLGLLRSLEPHLR
ncbi:CBS domain-containing protein [Nocardia amikacinitolerans]|uniref:CBS domain-containing protein n=1 Tax=Nocardia amikacinitolerans TaxID=756689 RepID=UPI0036B2FF1C